MEQFIYRITPTRLGMLTDGPTEREAAIAEQHFAYLKRLTAAGTVLMAGRTLNADEHTFGIVGFVAESTAHCGPARAREWKSLTPDSERSTKA